MGYENVDPATLQTLLGSPPVATYGGDPVATTGGRFDAVIDTSSPAMTTRPTVTAPYGVGEGSADQSMSPLERLLAALGANLKSLDFTSAITNLRELNYHLSTGIEHWIRFVLGKVDG